MTLGLGAAVAEGLRVCDGERRLCVGRAEADGGGIEELVVDGVVLSDGVTEKVVVHAPWQAALFMQALSAHQLGNGQVKQLSEMSTARMVPERR